MPFTDQTDQDINKESQAAICRYGIIKKVNQAYILGGTKYKGQSLSGSFEKENGYSEAKHAEGYVGER